MKFKMIFIGTNGFLRSGWRALIFFLVFAKAGEIIGRAINSFIPPGSSMNTIMIINYSFLLALALFAGWACGKLFEKLPFRALGAWFSGKWLTHFLLGLAAGVLTFLAAVAIAYFGGGLRFEPNGLSDLGTFFPQALMSFVVLAAASAMEEVVFRGYLLQTFTRAGLPWIAISITAVGFGLMHIANPNATTISTMNTVLAGIWFGLAYLKTRDLWFVWGMHLMWNFIQGTIFGIEISGLTYLSQMPLLKEIDSGPQWLTGSVYGIEGGIPATIAILLSIVAIGASKFIMPDSGMLALTSPGAPDGDSDRVKASVS